MLTTVPVMITNLARLLLVSIICILSNAELPNRFIPNINITKANFAAIVLCTNSKYFCSGVIVDVTWVLTAAHCLHDLSGTLTEDDDSVLVVAGTKGLPEARADIKSGKAQIRKSKSLVIHGNYTWKQNFVNDIALIEMAEAFVTSERVAVAVLNTTVHSGEEIRDDPEHNMDEVNIHCSGYGYGKVSEAADNVEDKEIKGQYYMVTKHCHCLEWIRSYKSPVDIMRPRNIFLCNQNGHLSDNGFCLGDNGGPLVCDGALRAITTAIFHYNKRSDCKLLDSPGQTGCASSQSLNVFTDLCYFGDWLHSIVPAYPHLDELCKIIPSK